MRLRNFLDDPSDRKPNRRLNKYADANHEGTPYHKDSRNDANKAKRTKKPGRNKITFRHLNYCRHIVQYAVICPDLRIVQFFPVDHTGGMERVSLTFLPLCLKDIDFVQPWAASPGFRLT